MKTILLNIIFIINLFNYNIFAQSKQNTISFGPYYEKIILESEIVFEGEVVKVSDFIDTTLHKLFRSDLIKIIKVIRGNNLIVNSNVEVITDLQDVAIDSQFGIYYIPRDNQNIAIDLPVAGKGIYFGKQTTISINNSNVYTKKGEDYKSSKGNVKIFDNNITVKVSAATDLNVKNYYESSSSKVVFKGIRAFGQEFKTKNEYYEFISKFPNIIISKDIENK